MEEKVTIEKTGWWKSFLKSEFFYHYKHNIPAIIGSILVVVAILVAVFGRFLAPQNPYDLTAISLADSYLPPVWLDGGKAGFLLGSDEQGRDILSAIIYGSASSIMIGLVGMICSCAIGTTLGLLAGYFGGKVDAVIMRIADVQLSFPSMLIADEPTTALDVTIQEQILKLMKKLVKEHNTSLMLITHDLAVVSQMVDKINVMYCGKLVETGKTEDIIYHNAHPYTEGLLNSIPKLYEDRDRLDYIPGMVPNMFELPEGCYFAPRCKYCQEICRHEKPQMQEVGPGHMAACHFPLLKKKEQEEA